MKWIDKPMNSHKPLEQITIENAIGLGAALANAGAIAYIDPDIYRKHGLNPGPVLFLKEDITPEQFQDNLLKDLERKMGKT